MVEWHKATTTSDYANDKSLLVTKLAKANNHCLEIGKLVNLILECLHSNSMASHDFKSLTFTSFTPMVVGIKAMD